MPESLHLENPYVWRTLGTVVLIVGSLVLTRALRGIMARVVTEPARFYRLSKLMGRIISFGLLLLLIVIWAPGRSDILTVLTVIGAGTAIAMREALMSMAGWCNLVVRQHYRAGDRIEINGIRGDVIDIRLLHTTLMEVGGWVEADQSTGRIVHIPNAWIFLHGLYNYNQGFHFVWNELAIAVTLRSDWQRAREIMHELAQESAQIVASQAAGEIRQLSREYLVHYSILTPFVYVSLAESGVLLTLRYLCEVRKRRGTQHAFTLALLEAFRDEGIEIAPRYFVVNGGTGVYGERG